jgi:hypothetical protein
MQRIVNVPALHGVVVHVFQLLQQDRIVLDLLRLTSFLPKLIVLVDLMAQLVILKLFQQRFRA